MSDSLPLVSVIIPAYNAAATLGRAIDSVLAQTHFRLEILVIDDASIDATLAIAKGYGPAVQWLHQAHQGGVYAARNRGLAEAHGAFIAFLDADDWWFPDRLARQLPLFSRPEVGLVFGDVSIVDERTVPSRVMGRGFDRWQPARGNILFDLARHNFIPSSTVITRKVCFDRVGPFSHLDQDYLKWMEILLYWEADFVEKAVTGYALSTGSLSSARLRQLEDAVRVFECRYTGLEMPEQRRAFRAALIQLRWRLVLNHLWQAAKALCAVLRPQESLAEASLGERLQESGRLLIAFCQVPFRVRWRAWQRRMGWHE